MANKTINHNQLTPGAIFFVRGRIVYSRLARQTTDEEREKQNKNRTHPIDKNYTTVTLCDAEVIPQDAQHPTPEEIYAYESLYDSKKEEYTGKCYSAINKSRNLPTIRVKNDAGAYEVTTIERELANGLNVTICMRVFQGSNNNKGVSLDTVLVNEPIKFYTTDTAVIDAAAKLGLVLAPAPASNSSDDDGDSGTEITTASTTSSDSGQAPPPATDPFSNAAPAETNNNPFVNNNPFASAANASGDGNNDGSNPFGAGNRKY